jgi:hypothetical protein
MEYSEWVCEFSPGLFWRPYKGQEPSSLGRLFDRLWLGYRWTRMPL